MHATTNNTWTGTDNYFYPWWKWLFGSFFLACKDYRERSDESFLICSFFFFLFKVEISWHTPTPLYKVAQWGETNVDEHSLTGHMQAHFPDGFPLLYHIHWKYSEVRQLWMSMQAHACEPISLMGSHYYTTYAENTTCSFTPETSKLAQSHWIVYKNVKLKLVKRSLLSWQVWKIPHSLWNITYFIRWQCFVGSWVCLELVIVAAFLQKDGCLLVVQPPKLASVGFWHMAAETISGVWDLPAHVARFIGVIILWVICNTNPPNDSHPSLILTSWYE